MFANMKRSIKMLTIASFTIFATLIVPVISFAQTGSVRISKEVATDFEAYKFDPNYDYYFMNLKNDTLRSRRASKGLCHT